LADGDSSRKIAFEEDGFYVSIYELSNTLIHNLADFHSMHEFVTNSLK